MSIQAKVADCEDIEANVRKFLVERAASSHHTFMPFSVERVPKFYRTGITSYRAMMYRTVAQSMGKPQPYLQPIHSNSKKLNRSTVQYGSREKQHLLDGAMFQTFYAEKMSLEKPTARPRKSQRKVVASKPHLQQPESPTFERNQNYWQKLFRKEIPIDLPPSLVSRRTRPHHQNATYSQSYRPFNTLVPLNRQNEHLTAA